MNGLRWEEAYDGTRWHSNGVFHVAGAFEDAERLGSPYLYYVYAAADWDETNAIGDGFKSPEKAMDLAQRLQNAFDGRSFVLTNESLKHLIDTFNTNTMADALDPILIAAWRLRDVVLAAELDLVRQR